MFAHVFPDACFMVHALYSDSSCSSVSECDGELYLSVTQMVLGVCKTWVLRRMKMHRGASIFRE